MDNLRSAIRQLISRPGLSVIIVLMLALGIGVNMAMFAIFHQVLLRPLPVPDPESLVILSSTGPKVGSVSWDTMGDVEQVFSYPMLHDLQREQTVFTGIAAHSRFSASVAKAGGRASFGRGMLVNDDYFSVLGLTPALGRLIGPEDAERTGEGKTIVLSYDYWQNHFGGDPEVLGATLLVNGQSMTVIGVAPEGFTGASPGERPQVYVPLTMRWLMQPHITDSAESRLSYWVYLFARLKSGVSRQQAETAINVPYRAIINDVEAPLNPPLSDQYIAEFKLKSLVLKRGARGQSSTPEEMRLPLTLLFGVTVVVLAITCVNIVNLMLARGVVRAGEMTLRAALGATRRQMVGQLVTEAGLLGVLGCLAGLPLAAALLALIGTVLPSNASAGLGIGMSAPALVFGAAMLLVTALAFGLFPAIAATRELPGSALKEQAGRHTGGRGMARFRQSLVTMQIAFSLVLLVLAGLFAQSLANVVRVDLGLSADSVATFWVAPLQDGHPPEPSAELFKRIEQDLAALPGAIGVGSSTVPVIGGMSRIANVSVQALDARPDTETFVPFNVVSPGFFQALEIPLLSGRGFGESDTADSPRVAIVNEAFARKFALGKAIGTRMAVGSGGGLDIEIIGLVADAKYSEVKEDVPPLFYLASYQDETQGVAHYYVRTAFEPREMLASMSNVVARIDPSLPVRGLAILRDEIRERVYLDHLLGLLSAGFALLATLLAATGLYGVLSYSVTQRTRELGLRQALGATPGRLRLLVLRQVGWMGVIGGTIGFVCAVLAGHAAEAILFGLTGYDPVVLGLAVALLGIVVLAAAYLPARRASSVDIQAALRCE